MKTKTFILLAGIISFLSPRTPARASSTIDAANRYTYAPNLGWVDWRGDTTHGAVIGAYVCSAYLYAANVGWISLRFPDLPRNQVEPTWR